MAKKTTGDPVKVGTGQIQNRVNGKLVPTRLPNYAGVSNETMKSDRKVASGTGSGNYPSNVAPRIGGETKKGPGKVVSFGNSSALNKKNIGKLKK